MPFPPPDPSDTIVTARLGLVPLRVEDAAEMVHVLRPPELYGFIGGTPPSRSELARRYRAQVAGRSPDGREVWRNWILRERQGSAAVGFVQATIVERRDGAGRSAEIAWLIGVPWQGRGYATEAAAALLAWLGSSGVSEVVAHVHPDHRASAGVAERIGLTPTSELVDGERVWCRTSEGAGQAS
jgi:RimJ/RimL family protein N-acetyltransferase